MSKWNVGKCAVCGNDLAASVVCVIENSPTESYRHGVLVECPECKTRYKSVLSTASTASIAENIRSLADRMNAENLAIYEAFSKPQTEAHEEEPAEVAPTPLEIETEPETAIKTLRRTSLGAVYYYMKDACSRYGVDFCVSMGRTAQRGETVGLMDSLLKKYLKVENVPASELHHGNNSNIRRCQHVIKPPCVILTLPTTIARARKGVCFGVVYSLAEVNGRANCNHIRNVLGIEDEVIPRYLKETEVRPATLCKQLKKAREDFEHKRDILLGLGLINKNNEDIPAINIDMWSNRQFVADLRAALKSKIPDKVTRQVRELVEKYGLFVTL